MLSYVLVAAGVLLLMRMLAVSSRSGVLMLAAVLALGGGLAMLSPPRPVGDSRDHVAMATALAHFTAPRSISGEQRPWFYALAAAPFARAFETLGRDPQSGFTALNLLLLAGAAVLLVRRVSTIAAVLLAGGPILWWIDKPHPEVFLFASITAAFVLIRTAPWLAILALGFASAQEPAIVPALVAALVFAALPTGFATGRVWIAAAVALLLAALNPLSQYARQGGSLRALLPISPHLPLARELLSTPFDPNIGIFVHAPLVTAVAALALVLALVRAPRQVLTIANGVVIGIGALFILMFTQMLNVNSGGTPGPSRYGLWLLPVAIPVLEAVPPGAVIKVLTAASVVWCTIFFAPSRPENYLQPTRLATFLWQRWPAADDPLVEIFSERVSGSQPAPEPPLATPGCEKVLIVGRGSGSPTAWPGRCDAQPAPPFCREVGVLCYANRSNGGYAYSRLPVLWSHAPAESMPRRGHPDPIAVATGNVAPFAAVGLGAGWSYLEELPDRDIRWRWMNEQAELGVETYEPLSVRLRVDTRAHARPRRLQIRMPAGEVATWIVTPTRATFETGAFQLPAGPTVIRFESLDGADKADGEDVRRLSVAVFGIRVFTAP
jgi:hypothetical protein